VAVYPRELVRGQSRTFITEQNGRFTNECRVGENGSCQGSRGLNIREPVIRFCHGYSAMSHIRNWEDRRAAMMRTEIAPGIIGVLCYGTAVFLGKNQMGNNEL